MDKQNRREFPTEWLNLMRFLAIFFIMWSHFDNRIFAAVNPTGMNVQKLCFFPPTPGSVLFYGYTGKYAVTMLCVISGFITAWSCDRRSRRPFVKFVIRRYLRLILPVTGISLIYLAVCALSGRRLYSAASVLHALFCLGSEVIVSYYWCLPAFLLGNCLIYLLVVLDQKVKKISPPGKLALLGCLVVGSFLVSYKIYNSRLFWTTAVLAGYLVYQCYMTVDIKLPGYVIVLLAAVVYWLPRGEESLKIYMRCTLASCIVVYALLHMKKTSEKISGFCRRKKVKELLKYSYPLFIVHGFTEFLFSSSVIWQIQARTQSWWLTYLISFALKTLCDFAAAFLIHYIFEEKIQRRILSLLRL